MFGKSFLKFTYVVNFEREEASRKIFYHLHVKGSNEGLIAEA